MFLFRPSNNNQRYAFVPLLDHSDNEEDSEDDEEKGFSSTKFMMRQSFSKTKQPFLLKNQPFSTQSRCAKQRA